jgi:hypothetical protein
MGISMKDRVSSTSQLSYQNVVNSEKSEIERQGDADSHAVRHPTAPATLRLTSSSTVDLIMQERPQ